MEFIAITVSNNSELRSHWFGSSIGEEFYHSYNILNEAIIPFHCFSILKKQGEYLFFFFNHFNFIFT